MNMIFKIAKAELKNLFFSPVAWFLSIAFWVQSAACYCGPLLMMARTQEISIKNMPKFKGFGDSLTRGIFINGDSIFRSALQNLYLFIPLLTMGLISREINNGTLKLLYSSPIKTRQIVLGKYMAVLLYNVMLVAIVGVFIVMGLMQIKDVDYGLLLSSLLAFYLLVSAFSAIGLFMSSLTTYQIVAAISCFMTIFILGRVGLLWQKYDFVRDLTYFLSINGRTAKMITGLITSKDVMYFVLITAMFVTFTIIKLKTGRESKSWVVVFMRYSGVLAVVLVIGYFTSRPAYTAYWDTTTDKVNTLPVEIQDIVKQMKNGELEVTLYCNLLSDGAALGFPQYRNDYLARVWESYIRFKPDMKFKYVYYYDIPDGDSTLYKSMPGKSLKEIAALMAQNMDMPLSMFMPPAEIRKKVDLSDERYRVVMELKYNGKKKFLRTFPDNSFWPDNRHIAPVLKRLLESKMPKLLFTTGHLERDLFKEGERDYFLFLYAKTSRESMVNLGFDADTIRPDRAIPTDIATLVLADPKVMLDSTSQQNIQRYIDAGGNLMVLAEPGKQHVVNPILNNIGVNLPDGIVVMPTRDEAPDMIKPVMTQKAALLANDRISQFVVSNMKEGDTLRPLDMSGAISVNWRDTAGFKADVLMNTVHGEAWLKKGVLVADSATPVFNGKDGDVKQDILPLVVGLSRKIHNKEQRIVVCGDADFMSSLRQRGAFIFVPRALLSWLDYNIFPVYGLVPLPKDELLTISESTASLCKLIFVWIVPVVIALGAIILLIRRKRQ